MSVMGHFYAAQTSRRIEARLRLSSTTERHLTILDGQGASVASALLNDVIFGDRIVSAPRRLTFPDGSVFETDEHDAIALLEGDTRNSRLHGWEAFHPRLLGVVAMGVVGVWGIWRYGLDILAAGAIALTPPAMYAAMDAGTVQAIDRTIANPTMLPEDEQARIRDIFDDLLAILPEDSVHAGQSYTLGFRSAPGIGPNAFALPGGTIIMTDAFARQFPNENILAGVLGHEIGHVVERHGLRQVYRSLGIYILVALMAGDTGPILEDILLEGNLLLSLSFSRDAELEADAFGVDLIEKAGYDPRGLAAFFEAMMAQGGGASDWRSTHPASADRVERIEELIGAR